MPTRRFQPPSAKDPKAAQAYAEIADTFDAFAPLGSYALLTDALVSVAAGSVSRLGPRATGQNVVIPEASGSNFGQTITLFVQNALGQVRIRPTAGTINGASAFTLAAGYTTVIVLRSGGDGKWMTERASGFPVAGDSLAYDGETLDYVGTNSLLVLSGITGNQGTVDISSLVCGGTVAISGPVAAWQIEGFTSTPVKPDGFWFFLAAANTSFLGTLFNEDATPAATDRIRCTSNIDYSAQAMQAVIHKSPLSGLGGSARWFAVTGNATGAVQRTTTGGTITDFVLNPNTRTLQIDSGNTAWVIDSIAGGYAGRKLTIENASNVAATGSIVSNTVAAGTAGNLIVTPDNVTRGGYNRYAAELEYDGTDSIWRIVSDTGPQLNSTQILEIRWVQTADASINESIPSGCTWFEAEGVGGGGGSGGCDADGVKESCASGGGGAGAWFRHRFTVTTGVITGAVGAAGAAGTNTGGNGGTGGTTTVTYDGVSITGPGGAGSAGNTTGNDQNTEFTYIAGALGATADANATERADGGDGDTGKMWAVSAADNSACGGLGGASYYGGGGRPGFGNTDSSSAAGSAGRAPGSGGGGSARVSTGAASTGIAGAAGAPGAMKLTFYSGPRPTEATIN